jgi:hypothetical protein
MPLTPERRVTCFIQQSSRHFPSELLIAHNERDSRYFDIHWVNVALGKHSIADRGNPKTEGAVNGRAESNPCAVPTDAHDASFKLR